MTVSTLGVACGGGSAAAGAGNPHAPHPLQDGTYKLPQEVDSACGETTR
jgi:hypothetical protein